MIDFIDSSTEFSEENISSVELNYADYTTEYDSFSDNYCNFFAKDTSYVVSRFDENNQKSTDDAYTVIEHNKNGLTLKNTLETEYGTVERYIILDLKSSIMEEWMEVSNEYGCHISGYYKMEKINLSSDEKELTFVLKTRDSLQTVIKIGKL
ncbi:hypothetical protein [Wolbachia endosymbiont of Ctenocephalides felis wCfeJ]|uniref:hypothetical protein n=1 Tax=Wolbachia endosymbiont of Ctenocephalides felis wCfeJ TaxID=2732594 RepID=UPI001445CCD1|nr:hypothetical protein [Wolbachia endosymbiont of Ctenocephalides felis wCfeJ]WCR58464.1 MAG: hypothetical protein PG980_000936 [Wolbachia endosymbiont of Ctenocephalides felis wCfeJ]